jgi:hypothetical protein
MVADVDNIEFLEAYSYTDASEYANDPIGVRTNTTYTHREYKYLQLLNEWRMILCILPLYTKMNMLKCHYLLD